MNVIFECSFNPLYLFSFGSHLVPLWSKVTEALKYSIACFTEKSK